MGLDQAEQLPYPGCKHVQLSVLYCTTYWCQFGLSRGFVDTCEQICEGICECMNDRQIHSGLYRLAPASKNRVDIFILFVNRDHLPSWDVWIMSGIIHLHDVS